MSEVWSAVLLRVASMSWTERQSLDTPVVDDLRCFYLEMSPQDIMGRKMPCRLAVAAIGYECEIWQFSPLGCFCPVLPSCLTEMGQDLQCWNLKASPTQDQAECTPASISQGWATYFTTPGKA